jgi:hypothetical protein
MVDNDPVGGWDWLGKDIWVENTTAVLGFHRRICVTKWKETNRTTECCVDGKHYEKDGKFCISFGARNNGGSSSASGPSGASESGGVSSGGGSSGLGSGSCDSSGNGSSGDGSSSSAGDGAANLPPNGILPPGMSDVRSNADGEVYPDNDDPATKVVERYKQDCKADMTAYNYMKSLLYVRGNYALAGQNCRDFSKYTYDELKTYDENKRRK